MVKDLIKYFKSMSILFDFLLSYITFYYFNCLIRYYKYNKNYWYFRHFLLNCIII